MVDLDADPDDPDLPAHTALAALLEVVRAAALPEGEDAIATVLNFPRATVWVIATIGLLLDKRLAMNERNRG